METIHCTLKTISSHDDFLRFVFEVDGQENTFDYHYLWLRHQCPCCVHPTTHERIICPSTLPFEIKPYAYDFSGNQVKIVWNDDARHCSVFTVDFLFANAYAKNQALYSPKISPIETVTFDMNHNVSRDNLFKKAILCLKSNGYAILKNYGTHTECLIEDMSEQGLSLMPSHFGRYEDLKQNNTTNKNTDQLGYTNAGVDLHTDLPFIDHPPRYQALQCLEIADSGGENYIADGIKAARYLKRIDPQSFNILATTPIRFDRKQKEYSSQVEFPIINCKSNDIIQIRYSYFTMAPLSLPFSETLSWYRAYKKFASIVHHSNNHAFFLLNPGDVVVYDNYRMLHAREGFQGKRWMRGIFFSS